MGGLLFEDIGMLFKDGKLWSKDFRGDSLEFAFSGLPNG
jgi:hypothetical protein